MFTINRLQGSDNVFVNGIGVSRQGDNNTVDLLFIRVTNLAFTFIDEFPGSTTVFVNNKGCGRIGDSISSCTSVVQGSENVLNWIVITL